MNWKTIRLELGGTPDFPAGSVSRGYLVRLPLTADGVVDEAALSKFPRGATARRFWSNEPEENCRLQRVNGQWALHRAGESAGVLEIDSRAIAVGDELSMVQSDGSRLPFRVASIGRTS